VPVSNFQGLFVGIVDSGSFACSNRRTPHKTRKNPGHSAMESVQRAVLGGIFLKARDPKKLADWYRQSLGIPLEEGQTYASFLSEGAGEMTVWSTFPADTKYFGTPSPFMVNYRVRDLDAMLAQLRAAGAQVDDKVEDYDYGRFAWATDPEGNRFELWQPLPG
jgi:predicted enzyme related to lactoylglutathione lyase